MGRHKTEISPKQQQAYDGSTPLKNIMQEMFVSNLLRGMSQGKAYRQAGYKAKDPYNGSAIVQRNSKVLARLAYKRGKMAKKLEITEEGQIERFQVLSNGAVKVKQFSAAVQAEDRICTILGLFAKDNEQKRQQVVFNMLKFSIDKELGPGVLPLLGAGDVQGPE